MCGIFGYLGNQNAISLCIEGLKKLEYRGYDSSGLACVDNGSLYICKETGKVASLEKSIQNSPSNFHLGIAHTRWATHGAVTKENTHPHIDQNKTVAVVHNGVIENYSILKEDLIKNHKVSFASETDTEVIAQSISIKYKGDFLKAVQDVCESLEGAFALTIIHKDFPNQMIATAEQCPLVVAYSEETKELFVSSDAGGLPDMKLDLYRLEKGEIAFLTRGEKPLFFNKQKEKIEVTPGDLSPGERLVSKGNFEHFMLKEIFEQSETVKRALEHCYDEKNHNICFDDLMKNPKLLQDAQKVVFIACGTSYHAGLLASYLFESIAGIESKAEIASEYCYRDPVISANTLIIALSQSGETADTLAAVKLAKKKNSKILALCNVPDSTLTFEADATLFLHAGAEVAVASTKTFTSQVVFLYALALFFSEQRGLKIEQQIADVKRLYALPGQIVDILHKAHEIETLAKKYAHYENMFFLGRSILYPTALEAALKLKEIAYINAQGFPSGEMKHGPIALLNKDLPVVVFCANSKLYKKIKSNLMESKARQAPIIAVGWKENENDLKDDVNDHFWIPKTSDELAPILLTIFSQLFTYYISKEKGTEIDKPKNLAKSCTVE
jgi:glutamine---fructose-6-phosphate transaminase (isomerizing)